MAVTLVDLNFTISDLIGANFNARRTRVWIETNVDGDVIIDTSGDAIHLGNGLPDKQGNGYVTDAGVGKFTGLVATNSTTNPTAFQYRVWVEYDKNLPQQTSNGHKERWSPGWFSLTATSNLADVAAESYAPPTWQSAFITSVEAAAQAKVDEASGFADDASGYASDASGYASDAADSASDAAASAALAHDISGISTPDGVVEALINDTGSDTASALNASIDEVGATKAVDEGTDLGAALVSKFAQLANIQIVATLDDMEIPFHYLHGVNSVNGLPVDPAGTIVAIENAILSHPGELLMIDADVRESRDGVQNFFHNDTTGSVSAVDVTVAQTNFRDMPPIEKPILYGSGHGPLPAGMTESVLAATRGRAVFSLELKAGISGVAGAAALCQRTGTTDKIVWNTGDPTVVAALVAAGLRAFMFNCNTTTKIDQAATAGAWMIDVPTDASTALVDYAVAKTAQGSNPTRRLGAFEHVMRGFIKTDGTPQATDQFAQLVGMDARLSSYSGDATGYLDRSGGASLRSTNSIAGPIRVGKRGPGWRLVNSSNITDWLVATRLYTYKAGAMVYTFGDLAGLPYPAGISIGQSGALQTITAKVVMDTLPTTVTQSTRLKLYSPTEAPANASANTVEGYVLGLQADGLLFLNSVPVGGGSPLAVFSNIQGKALVAGTEATVTLETDDHTAGTQQIRVTRQDAYTTLSSAISAGTITALPVAATPAALANGAKLLLADGTVVNVNGAHTAGVTSITITSIAVAAQASGSALRVTSGWVNETTGGKAIWRGMYHSAYTTQTTGVGALTDLAIA